MNRLSVLVGPICFLLAAALSVGTAVIGAITIERRSIADVRDALGEDGIEWVQVSADGLQLFLEGTAPDEADRFRAATRAAAIIDPDRVINRLEVEVVDRTAPPRLSLDMLRNGDGIQLIGLIPDAEGEDNVVAAISEISIGLEVVNMIETAEIAAPPTWEAAMEYGLRALQALPRSKVTVFADRVEIEAISASIEERARLLATLQIDQPEGVEVVIDISAPRQVVTPFTLRFVRDADGARFESCTADTQAARDRILAAAAAAGAEGQPNCIIGLGVPSPSWSQAVEVALEALTELGEGSVTFSDADVTFIAAHGTGQDNFDHVVGELGAALPDLFSLQAVLPEATAATAAGPARFLATLEEDRTARLRGRLPEGPVGLSVRAFANALFGSDRTNIATREVVDLPEGWSVRVMAGLDALSRLNDGELTVEPDTMLLRGHTGNADLLSDLTRFLSDELGPGADFQLDVVYLEELDPVASLPTPEECVARIEEIQDLTKITFDPGSTEINDTAGDILDAIAVVLPDCLHARMEIGGHTDAQGGETMNLNLSQARADAVLNGLLARGILTSNLTSQGYGESLPIADNETEEGREQNRRIEFRLLSTAEIAGEVEEPPLRALTEAPSTRPTMRPDPPEED